MNSTALETILLLKANQQQLIKSKKRTIMTLLLLRKKNLPRTSDTRPLEEGRFRVLEDDDEPAAAAALGVFVTDWRDAMNFVTFPPRTPPSPSVEVRAIIL